MYNLSFIPQGAFEHYVAETVSAYARSLRAIDLHKFNENVIDPIKLLFDQKIYRKSFEEVISLEIQRQRDKTNTNVIGYSHQNLFKLFPQCEVPKKGWDVIVTRAKHKIYAELKNKHNTMNSSSSKTLMLKMQACILENPNAYCYLVEVLAPHSRNDVWEYSNDGVINRHEHIRRVSVDRFYKEITGIEDAFYQICMQLPLTLEKIIASSDIGEYEKDSVIEELKKKNPDLLKALYMLAFEHYEGFGAL